MKPANRYLLVLRNLDTYQFVPHFFVSIIPIKKGLPYFKLEHDLVTVYDTHEARHLDPDELMEA